MTILKMTAVRFTLYCFSFLMLCLAVAAIYTYQHFPSLLSQQLKPLLSEYGVTDLTVEPMNLSGTRIETGEVQLQGEYDGAPTLRS